MDLAYLPDVAEMYDDAWEELKDLDCWIVDALRRTPHPTHAHLDKALEWIGQVKPRRAVLTNMHIDLDYATVEGETADHITPAYDGMVIRYPPLRFGIRAHPHTPSRIDADNSFLTLPQKLPREAPQTRQMRSWVRSLAPTGPSLCFRA